MKYSFTNTESQLLFEYRNNKMSNIFNKPASFFRVAIPAFLLASCGQAEPESAKQLTLLDQPQSAQLAAEPAKTAAPEPFPMPKMLSGREQDDLLEDLAGAELFNKVMLTKAQTGRVVAPGQRRNLEKAQSDLQEIKDKLSALSKNGLPTYALLHSLKNDVVLRSWLIGPDGGIVSGFYDRQYQGLGFMAQGLGVVALAKSRGPRPEGEPPVPPAEITKRVTRDQSPAAVAKRFATLDQTLNMLLPGNIAEVLGSRSGRLLVIPARDTGTAPYAALPLKNGVAAMNWSFVVLPAVGMLTQNNDFFDIKKLNIDKAIIVGNPDLRWDPKSDWADLPSAEKEARSVATKLSDPTTLLLTGAEATRNNFVKAIQSNPDAGIIYMATHAVANPKLPLTQGYMAMAGEHYYAGHVRQENFAGWKTHHPLVVMSACQTTLGRFLDGGGFGVATTWITAGAGQVVGSLWNVSDNATARLMDSFVDGLKSGLVPEVAMQRAQIKTMNYTSKRGNQIYRKDPKMWASFTVYGKPSI
jgi:hypothetical protein